MWFSRVSDSVFGVLLCSNPNNAMSSAFSCFLKFYQSFTIFKLLPARSLCHDIMQLLIHDIHLPSCRFNENTFLVNTANTLEMLGESIVTFTILFPNISTSCFQYQIISQICFFFYDFLLDNKNYLHFYYKVVISNSSLLVVIQIQK